MTKTNSVVIVFGVSPSQLPSVSTKPDHPEGLICFVLIVICGDLTKASVALFGWTVQGALIVSCLVPDILLKLKAQFLQQDGLQQVQIARNSFDLIFAYDMKTSFVATAGRNFQDRCL